MDVSSVLLLGSGVFGLQRIIYPLEQICNINLMIILWLVLATAHWTCGALCIFQARKMTAIRGGYSTTEIESAAPSPQATTRAAIIGRVAFWLNLTGVVVCVLPVRPLLTGTLTKIAPSENPIQFTFWGKFFLNLLRCFKTIAQTQAMKPHQPKITPVWTHRTTLTIVWGVIRGLLGVRGDATVLDETYPSFHESQDSFFFMHPSGNPSQTQTQTQTTHVPGSLPASIIASAIAYSFGEEHSKGDVELSSRHQTTDADAPYDAHVVAEMLQQEQEVPL